MVWLVLYPAIAALAMVVLVVIIVILRFGPRLCGLRHHTLPDRNHWDDNI